MDISSSTHDEPSSSLLLPFDDPAILALRERVNYVHRPPPFPQRTFSPHSVIAAVYSSDADSPFFGLSPLPNLSTLPQLEGEANYAYLVRVEKECQNRVIAELEISPMTCTEIAQYNFATLRRLERIRVLEEAQEYLLPRWNVEIERALFAARTDYRARVCRTFRLHDLPVEIIQNIFRLVCWSANSSNAGLKCRARIASVCSRWRRCLLSDRTMWSDITLTDARDFPRAVAWLGRADQVPTAVRITDSPAKPWTMEEAKFVVNTLFTKLPSIRILVLVLREWDPIAYILESLTRAAHSGVQMIVEHLEVHHFGASYRQQKERSTQLGPLAPSLFDGIHIPTLRNVTVVGFPLDWSRSVLRNLTTLDLRHIHIDLGPTIHEFREILLCSPRLSKLFLSAAGPKTAPKALMSDVLRKPVMLSHLKTLFFAGFGCDYGLYLLAQFLCPNVINLQLMNVVGDYSPLYFLMTNKTPNVRSLTIHGAEIDNNNRVAKACFIKWLHSMPDIEFLRVKNITPEHLNLFNWFSKDLRNTESPLPSSRKGGDPICYRLKTVEIHNMPPDLVSIWASKRYAWCIPLTKLYFVTDRSSLTANEVRLLRRSVSGPVVVTAYAGKAREEIDLLGETA